MPHLTVFFDDGGVMNDNSRRAPEWQRLVGEFFAPRLGSTREAWSLANRQLATGVWERAMLEQARLGPIDTYEHWSRLYQTGWLRTMAEHVGVDLPKDDDAVFALAVEAARFVTYNCVSAFEDATEAIRSLAHAGFVLNTASGEDSAELAGYLTRMGVRDAFSHLFGPDLVNTFKSTPIYYARAFEFADLDPSRCLVVDDSAKALTWAAEAGALTVLMDRSGAAPDHGQLSISGLGHLLPLLERLESA